MAIGVILGPTGRRLGLLCVQSWDPKLTPGLSYYCSFLFLPGPMGPQVPGPRGPGPWAKRPGPLGQGAQRGASEASGAHGHRYRHTIQAYHTDTIQAYRTDT